MNKTELFQKCHSNFSMNSCKYMSHLNWFQKVQHFERQRKGIFYDSKIYSLESFESWSVICFSFLGYITSLIFTILHRLSLNRKTCKIRGASKRKVSQSKKFWPGSICLRYIKFYNNWFEDTFHASKSLQTLE